MARSVFTLVAADVNNDGNLDLAVTVQGGSNNHVSVLLGDGTGNFARPVNFPTDQDPLGIAAADLNTDGFTDLVTANIIGRSVTVLLNDGVWDTGPQGFGILGGATLDRTPVPLVWSPRNFKQRTPGVGDMVSLERPGPTGPAALGAGSALRTHRLPRAQGNVERLDGPDADLVPGP